MGDTRSALPVVRSLQNRMPQVEPSTLAQRSPRLFGLLVVVVIPLGASGTCIVCSIGVEQLAVHAIAVPVVLVNRLKFRPHPGPLFLAIWVGYLPLASGWVLFPIDLSASWPAADVFASLADGRLLLAIMACGVVHISGRTCSGLSPYSCEDRRVRNDTNGLLALINTTVDLAALFRQYWGSVLAASTVAERAAELGRRGSMILQQSEARLLCGLAQLLAD